MAYQRRPQHNRIYRFRSGRSRLLRRIVFVCCAAVLAVCVYKVGDYFNDYRRSIQQGNELRAAYMEETPVPATYPPTALPTVAETVSPNVAPLASSTAAAPSTPDPLATLPPLAYPDNPFRNINSRFQKLRRQNSDIVGWVSMGDILSEAVVQRDNTYYLRRDYLGYHNVNGAVFMDEACSLKSRPYTLTLYAHNMKTGAMFGSLRNYENIAFYRNDPFISFDTIYEEGRYVIFSVATISTKAQASNYSGFYRLPDCTNLERSAIIQGLRDLSEIRCPVDVRLDDQLLLLVTCVGDETDRRIVAARRIRDDENEFDLRNLIQSATKR